MKIFKLNNADRLRLLEWMSKPNGGFNINGVTFESVEDGGILIRPHDKPIPKPSKVKKFTEKPFATHFSDSDGKKYQVGYFNGYHFGDRLLEGVMFKAEILPDGRLEVSCVIEDWSKHPYLRSLNEEELMERALNWAKGNDLFQITESGRGDGDELAFEGSVTE